jgi:hypothetical protein
MYNNGIKSGICKRSIESKKGWSPFDVDAIRCDLCQMKPLRSHSVDVINCLSKFVLCVQLTHLQSIRKLFILLPFKHEKRKALCCHSNMRKGRLFVAIQTWEKEGSLLPFKHEKRKALCCHSNMKKGRLFVAIQTWEKEGSLLPFKHEKRKALCCHSNMRKGRLFGTVHTFSSFSCLICCFVLSLYYCQFLYPNHIFWIVLLSSVYNFASRRHMLNLCNCV